MFISWKLEKPVTIKKERFKPLTFGKGLDANDILFRYPENLLTFCILVHFRMIFPQCKLFSDCLRK